MTTQESFKRRIRERMSRTGERYGAARRSLIAQSSGGRRTWVSEPEHTDTAVRDATGRGWDEWCDLIEAWPGHTDGHAAVASHLRSTHSVDGWWSQAVTGGWERITGRRLPNQMADGTFTASRSRTVTVDHAALRAALLDEEDRRDLFPGEVTELRSRPSTKALRVRVGPGTAVIDLAPRPDGRVTVSVAHERLPSIDDLAEWKAWWGDWLEALDES